MKSRINRGRLELAKRLQGQRHALVSRYVRMHMDCRRAEELLSDHLEGTLHAAAAEHLESHLEECAALPSSARR